MIKILIAPNSFKECSDSVNISAIIFSAFQKYLPVNIKKKAMFSVNPISDGGDGFLKVCTKLFDLKLLSFKVSAPFDNHKINCDAGYCNKTKTIYIESADIVGLKVVPLNKRKPLILSSGGMGEILLLLNDYIINENLQVDKVIIGIGGTAVTDLGLGACSKLGVHFNDFNGNINNIIPKDFNRISKITRSQNPLKYKLELVLDVDNPLLGTNGALQTFGRQKGLSREEIKFVEEGFNNVISKLNADETKINLLSGAGGGLAAGLQLFFDAGIKTSSNFIVKDLGINFEKDKFDLIITGEGKFDEQSLHSKGTMVVIHQLKKSGAANFIICGSSTINELSNNDFYIIEISKFFNSESESIKYYRTGIDLAVKQIVNKIFDLKL